MKIFLGGEGPTDLGSWADDIAYINARRQLKEPLEPGVLQSLLECAIDEAVVVVGARCWKKIRKYRAGDHRQAETRNVLGLILHAEDAHADAVVFARDRDGDKDRACHVEVGLEKARELSSLPIAGGIAIEELESWILALLGEQRSEGHRNPKAKLDHDHGIAGREAMVRVVEQTNFQAIPNDAHSLLTWLERARQLPVAVMMVR